MWASGDMLRLTRCFTWNSGSLSLRQHTAALKFAPPGADNRSEPMRGQQMQLILSISASGVRAAQAALGVAGHNIANLGTGGFRRQELRVSTEAGGGVSTSVSQSTVEGHAMETDLVALLQARTGFVANLQVFKASDRMLGSLLDITG